MTKKQVASGLPIIPVILAWFAPTLMIVDNASAQAVPSVSISAPADGATVNAGTTVTVTVVASGSFEQVGIVASPPLLVGPALSGAPLSFPVVVPADTT